MSIKDYENKMIIANEVKIELAIEILEKTVTIVGIFDKSSKEFKNLLHTLQKWRTTSL